MAKYLCRSCLTLRSSDKTMASREQCADGLMDILLASKLVEVDEAA